MFGEFTKFHPHWHVLILEDGFTEHDRSIYLPLGAYDGLLDGQNPQELCVLALNLGNYPLRRDRANSRMPNPKDMML